MQLRAREGENWDKGNLSNIFQEISSAENHQLIPGVEKKYQEGEWKIFFYPYYKTFS